MFGLKWPWVSRRRFEQQGETLNYVASTLSKRAKAAEAELARIKAQRSATTAKGNRTRAAKRRAQA